MRRWEGVGAAETGVLELYERALGDVYGYLVRRCPSAAVAEDLTAETFLAAARAAGRPGTELTVAWLIGTARHKLVDHWRRDGRQRQALEELYEDQEPHADPNDPVETLHVHAILASLPPHQRAALTLRYLDGLPVEEVARHLEKSVHATESLLMRAKAAYRRPRPPTTQATTPPTPSSPEVPHERRTRRIRCPARADRPPVEPSARFAGSCATGSCAMPGRRRTLCRAAAASTRHTQPDPTHPSEHRSPPWPRSRPTSSPATASAVP